MANYRFRILFFCSKLDLSGLNSQPDILMQQPLNPGKSLCAATATASTFRACPTAAANHGGMTRPITN